MTTLNKKSWPIKYNDTQGTMLLGARVTGELCLCGRGNVIQVAENIECPHCKSQAPAKPWNLPWKNS